jgi:hypothetical protein
MASIRMVTVVIFQCFFSSGELYNNLHQTRCPLLLVADYRFFNEMGGGSSKTTVNYLISLIDRLDPFVLANVFVTVTY